MPPRFAYWTIILDGTPTSFRTKEREEILPLFNQLKAKNPTALLKWFSGGTLWDSPEQAREERERVKVRAFREERAKEAKAEREGAEDPLAEFRRQHGRPADGSDDPSRNAGPSFPQRDDARPRMERPWSPGSSDPGNPRRGKDWRPGGDHRDPADKYRLPPGEARKRWKERNLRGPKPFGSKPGGDRPWGDKRGGPPSTLRQAQGRPEQGRGATRGGDDRSLRPGKPFGSKPGGDRPWSDRPKGDRPWSDKPRGPKPFGSKPPGDRPWSDKRGGPPSTRGGDDRSLRPGKPFGSKHGGDRPWSDRPKGDRPFSDRPRGPKPGGDRPWSDKRGGPPSTLRQAQGRPEQGRGATRGGDDRSLRPGKPFGSKPGGDRPFGDRKPYGDRKPFGAKPFGSKPGGPRNPFGARPPAGRPPKGRPPRGPRGKK